MNAGELLKSGCVPVAMAAEALGIEIKALCGFIARNRVGDPIGTFSTVYGWSCKDLAKRLAEKSSAVTE